MLFQKNIEPRCTYCQRGTPLDEEKILCTKQGVVAPGGGGFPRYLRLCMAGAR